MSRNATLKKNLKGLRPNPKAVAAAAIPDYNTKNISGHGAYQLDKWLRLLSMLNTSKVEPQFYRTQVETLMDLRSLIDECAKEDTYFTAQCIVYSRCVGEGLRTISHVAAALLAKYIGGSDWGKRFYSLWFRKANKGGVIYRLDDATAILSAFEAINGKNITNAMRKGFKKALEQSDSYSLLKYKTDAYNLIRLTHPNPEVAGGLVTINGEQVPTISAIRNGLSVSADTWETANSEAGQLVASAVKEGKVSKSEADTILSEAKAENWKGLLKEGKLGILAALRNIRSILKVATDSETLNLLCNLLSNGDLIRKGKIFPYQIDIAYETLKSEIGNTYEGRLIATALLKGYESAIPNLSEVLKGRTAVYLDCSGSMNHSIYNTYLKRQTSGSSCLDKASFIAATIAKATNADVIQFGTNARKVGYNVNSDVFSLSQALKCNLGSTNLSTAFQLSTQLKDKYDRIIILSDNECNVGRQKEAYKSYVANIGNPYIYSVDLASYGTILVNSDKVRYYFGYGYSMFEDISSSEFNPNYHIDKVKKIVI